MLSLPEQLLLLALDDNTGCDDLGPRLSRALIAAALLDLFLQGRIVRHEPPPRPNNGLVTFPWYPTHRISDSATATDNSYLDHVLTTISMHPMSNRMQTIQMLVLLYLGRTERSWSTQMADLPNANPPNQRLLAAQDLLAREELIQSESLSFGLIHRTHLRRTSRETQKDVLRHRLMTAVNARPVPDDERLIALLVLVRGGGLVANVFGKEKQDAADWRIQKLHGHLSPTLQEAGYYALAGIDVDDYYALKEFLS